MNEWTAKLPMTSAYFELALREFGGSAAQTAALREGIGEAAEQGGEITLGQQLQQIRNLNRLQPPGWALQLGDRFDAATHGPLGFAAVSAPTLAEGLAVLERFAHLRAPYFRLSARREGGWVALRVERHVPLEDAERIPLIELVLLSLQRLIASVRGAPLREARFDVDWVPPAYADRYGEYFNGPVRFAAPHVCLAVPEPWLGLKCPMADAAMYATALRTLAGLARRHEGEDHVVARVEAIIAASSAAAPTLADVAAHVRVSTRTLIRRLRHAGTTYNELLDAHRRQQAEALLANPDFDIAEVGYQLGYGDPANFGRACRRWFGMAPSRYRQHLRDRNR